jgi:hypothetical protein
MQKVYENMSAWSVFANRSKNDELDKQIKLGNII